MYSGHFWAFGIFWYYMLCRLGTFFRWTHSLPLTDKTATPEPTQWFGRSHPTAVLARAGHIVGYFWGAPSCPPHRQIFANTSRAASGLGRSALDSGLRASIKHANVLNSSYQRGTLKFLVFPGCNLPDQRSIVMSKAPHNQLTDG